MRAGQARTVVGFPLVVALIDFKPSGRSIIWVDLCVTLRRKTEQPEDDHS